MSETKRFKIPRAICGVYKLYQGKTVLYIGQSTDIAFRVRTHVRDGTKEFDRYSYEECAAEDLTLLECRRILEYKPVYNTQLPSNLGYRTTGWNKATPQNRPRVQH